jgi:hypothetical protein
VSVTIRFIAQACATESNRDRRKDLTMYTDRKSLLDDRLFLVLLLVPAMFSASRYLESKAEMDMIAMQNKSAATYVTQSPLLDPIVLAEAGK